MLARAAFRMSGNGGGRFYGVMAMGRPLILDGVRQPTALYALNVERVTVNPQAEIRDCEHLRAYYFKVESGTIQRPNAGDANLEDGPPFHRRGRQLCVRLFDARFGLHH